MTPVLPNWSTLQLVLPEVWLVIAMCVVILVPMIRRHSVALPAATALAGVALALLATLTSLTHPTQPVQHWLTAMLSVDPFSQFFKILLLVFTGLVIVQWLATARRDTHVLDCPDFLCLLLGATTGMALMASANNLLMIFIATEAASLPSFALAGWRKRHRVGSEGSLKYVLFGSVASAVSVYGMSLIYGVTGSLDLATIAAAAAGGVSPLLAVGLLALFAGFAFKLSAVPLHFWCPDVFQGAPIEVTTFLSVASKGAAVCLLVRVLHLFGGAAAGTELLTGMGVGVGILGAVTATWGNLVAYHQTNIKRLLAYSSIAHAGYVIMGASVILFAARDPAGPLHPQQVAGVVLFYLLVYLFMNLGAFTVAAVIAQHTGQEDIRQYAGLARRAPALAVLMILFLLSLFGMPGLGGFMGKIYLMVVMSKAGGGVGFVLIVVLLVNTLVSLYYYMRPAYYMVFADDEEDRPIVPAGGAGGALLLVCAAMLLLTGLLPGPISQLTEDHGVLHTPAATVAAAAMAPDKTRAGLEP